MMEVRRMELPKRKQDAASFKCKKVPLSSENLTQILKKNAAR